MHIYTYKQFIYNFGNGEIENQNRALENYKLHPSSNKTVFKPVMNILVRKKAALS